MAAMSLLSRLESKLGRYAVPNLTLFLIAGQVIVYLAQMLALPGARAADKPDRPYPGSGAARRVVATDHLSI